MRRFVRLSATALVAAVLGGCASLGGNVKSDFQCKAPGGTCSPTSSIDDQAIAVIGESGRRPIASAASSAAPAGPVTGGLRVVLPARMDRFGHWREETVVYVDRGPMAAPPRDVAGANGRSPRERLSLSELASGAPELGSLDGPRPSSSSPAAGASSSTDPLASIKAQVDAELEQAPRFISRPVIQGQTDELSSSDRSSPAGGSERDAGGEGASSTSPDAPFIAVAPIFPASEVEGD